MSYFFIVLPAFLISFFCQIPVEIVQQVITGLEHVAVKISCLGNSQLVLCITLGFLHKPLMQCGLYVPRMTLISLSLLTLTYFPTVQGPLEVGLMLSVS